MPVIHLKLWILFFVYFAAGGTFISFSGETLTSLPQVNEHVMKQNMFLNAMWNLELDAISMTGLTAALIDGNM